MESTLSVTYDILRAVNGLRQKEKERAEPEDDGIKSR